MKLQRNGFDFIFFRQDLQDYFRLRRGALSAEGRFIPMILLILSNFLLKMRIHSYFCRILIFAFLRFFFDLIGRFFWPAAGLNLITLYIRIYNKMCVDKQ